MAGNASFGSRHDQLQGLKHIPYEGSNGIGRGQEKVLPVLLLPQSGRRRISAAFANPVELGDVLGEKIIQHGADRRNHGEFGDVVPGGRHGRANDVGGERKFEREQNPGGELQPNLSSLHLVRRALEDESDDAAERLNRAEGHDKNRRGLDGERDEAGNLLEIVLDQYGADPPDSPAVRLARATVRRKPEGSKFPSQEGLRAGVCRYPKQMGF